MPGPPPKPLLVTPAQEAVLRSVARQHTAPQRLVRRLAIILDAAEGLGPSETAEHLRLSVLEDEPAALTLAIKETLSDAARSGTPPIFSAEQVAQLIALACEEPLRYGREVTHWTPRELADELVKQGIVESISPRSVGRFLKRGCAQTPSEPVLAQPRD